MSSSPLLQQDVEYLNNILSSELTAVLQVESNESRLERNNLPCPVGHASFDSTQETVGFLGFEGTLLAHVLPFVDGRSNRITAVVLCVLYPLCSIFYHPGQHYSHQ